MKRLLICAAILATFLLAQNSFAGTYGPSDSKFVLTPAPGWAEQIVDGGVRLTNGKSTLAIQIMNDEGLNAEQFADALAKELNLTDIKKDVSKEGINLIGKVDGVHFDFIIVHEEKKILCITKQGPDSKDIDEMMKSLHDIE